MDTPLLALRILAVGPFSIRSDLGHEKRIRWYRNESIDEILAELRPSIKVDVPRSLHEDGFLELSLNSFKDFRPDRILLTNSFTRAIKEARDGARKAMRDGQSAEQVKAMLRQVPGLEHLDFSVSERPLSSTESTSSTVEEILKMVAVPDEQEQGGERGEGILEAVDKVLSKYVDALYCSETFRSFESAWTGVKMVAAAMKGTENAEIGIVDSAGQELDDILDLLHGSLPLDLPSLMLFDSGFDNTPRSLGLLERVAEVCDTLLVPGVVELLPEFFGLDRWEELGSRPYIPHYLQEQVYAKWQSLRNKPGAKWLCAACNRLLARPRYGADMKSKDIHFAEEQFLWMSPVWGIGALCVQSVRKWGWPSRLSDWENCRLKDLPVRQVSTRKAVPTEAVLSEDRISQFAKAGIIAFASMANSDEAFVVSDNTIGQSSLGFQLLLSMTVQFLMWCRDHFAEDLPPQEIESGIRDILILLWQKRGYDISEGLEIRVSRAEKGGRSIVGLNLAIPREVLPKGGTISLEMPW